MVLEMKNNIAFSPKLLLQKILIFATYDAMQEVDFPER